tara:strand:- start:556 stop:1221 length:666 start_codon:yes stop_codon:yes gene_type:complete
VGKLIFRKEYELSELNGIEEAGGRDRGKVPILCIDDDGLEYEGIIRHHDFNIRVVPDINDIKAVSEYPIVICDIQGVGKAFKSQFQGAHIIEEIKKQYPNKVVIAYTGQKHDARYNKYFLMADAMYSKDMDSDQWVENLDQAVRKVVDPVAQWKRMREYLFSKDVPTRSVYLLELDYIESVLKKDKNILAKSKVLKAVSPDVRGVMQGFVASLLFNMMVGG